MGLWQTAHLFDYETFSINGMHELVKNDNKFNQICASFLKLTPYLEDGRSLPLKVKMAKVDELQKEYSAELQLFRNDLSLKEITGGESSDQKNNYINSIYNYHFSRFFNFAMFFEYAYFYPYLIAGKGGIQNKFKYNKSLGYELLTQLDSGLGNNYFSIEGYGIVGWLTNEETELLRMDLENLTPRENSYVTGFYNLVKIASKNNLGILLGADMIDDNAYKQVSSKIIVYNDYKPTELQGLCLEE